jgi:hypothetical protein
MSARRLMAEFRTRGVAVGDGMVFDADTALALIRRAEQVYVAVVGVEQVRAEELDGYRPMSGRPLRDMERIRSWGSARSYVEALADRGLYFDVTLESGPATWVAKLKYLFRTGATWSSRSHGDGSWLQ